MKTLHNILIKNDYGLIKERRHATEYKHFYSHEIVYLLPSKEISIVLNPEFVERNNRISGGKLYHNTALNQFPKEMKNGKTPTNYGYIFKFKTEGELESFLQEL